MGGGPGSQLKHSLPRGGLLPAAEVLEREGPSCCLGALPALCCVLMDGASHPLGVGGLSVFTGQI